MIDAEMYGMMPSAKIDSRSQRAAREHVEHAQDRARLLLEELRQLNGVDARHRDERADAVHDERAEQKQQAMAEIGGTRCVAEQSSRIDGACLRHL